MGDLWVISREKGLTYPENWCIIRIDMLLVPAAYFYSLQIHKNHIIILGSTIHLDRNRWPSYQKGGAYETLSEDRSP
jgi:hypothetical protein